MLSSPSLECKGKVSFCSKYMQKLTTGTVKIFFDGRWKLSVRLQPRTILWTDIYEYMLTPATLCQLHPQFDKFCKAGYMTVGVSCQPPVLISLTAETSSTVRKVALMGEIILGIAKEISTASLLSLLPESVSEVTHSGTRESIIPLTNSTENDVYVQIDVNSTALKRDLPSTIDGSSQLKRQPLRAKYHGTENDESFEVGEVNSSRRQPLYPALLATPSTHMNGDVPTKRQKYAQATNIRHAAPRVHLSGNGCEELPSEFQPKCASSLLNRTGRGSLPSGVIPSDRINAKERPTLSDRINNQPHRNNNGISQIVRSSSGTEDDDDLNYNPRKTAEVYGMKGKVLPNGNMQLHKGYSFGRRSLTSSNDVSYVSERENNVSTARISSCLLSIGFANLGNTCYMNAVLVSLRGLLPFRVWCENNSNEDKSTLLRLLLKLFKMSEEQAFAELKPILTKINQLFESKDAKFAKRNQNDAHEFVLLLLNLMLKEIPKGLADENLRSCDPFTWKNSLCYTCKECKGESTKDGVHKDLKLPLELYRRNNLQELLKKYERSEDISRNCSQCSGSVSMCSQSIRFHPDILLIVLLRFEYGSGSINSRKITVEVDVEERVSFFNQNYEFSSVVFHVGQETTNGHYMCYVRNSKKKDVSDACAYWKYDDDRVTPSNIIKMKEDTRKNGYLLFYRKSSPENSAIS